MTEDQPARPALSIVHGDPTPEELAALVAVLGSRAAASGTPAAATRSAWGEPGRLVRRPISPGPGGWRRSVLPG